MYGSSTERGMTMSDNSEILEKEEKSFLERISLLQTEMKVPKNLYNSHGNYYYRNAETIMESAKKACPKFGMTLGVMDEIVSIDGWHYVKAKATLYDWFSDETFSVEAYARETESRKGMDTAQVTGACSSYARKYALNGLFCLDDNKDPDTEEYQEEEKPTQKADPAALAVKLTTVTNELKQLGVDTHDEKVRTFICEKANVQSIDPGKLLLDTDSMSRVIRVMEFLIEKKK